MANTIQTVPIDFVEQSTPASNPAAGELLLYAKSDNSLYTLTSGGTETQMGAGAGNGRTFAFFMS